MTSNTLLEIPINDWPNLRDLYKKDWPKHHLAYNSIQNYITWIEKNPNIKNLNMFSLNGDWSDGTFIIVDRYSVLANTLSDNLDNLVMLLDLLDKSKYYLLFGITERILPGIKKLCNQNNFEFNAEESETIWYYLNRESITDFQVNIPKGIIIKQLTEENSNIINELWPHRHPASENMVKRIIKYNYTLGAFKEDSGELIAWCLRLPLGSLGILQVKDEYKRQGYGSLMVKSMSKFFYDQNLDVTAPVVVNNAASRNMFLKLGFKEVDKIYFLKTQTTNASYVWNENDDD